MNEGILRNYAKLLVTMGVNIDKGQTVVISCGIDSAFFSRMVAEAAYEHGAGEVVFNWDDEQTSKLRFLKADDGIFDEYPSWRVEFFDYYDSKKAAYIRISSSDPELLKDVPSDRIMRMSKAERKGLKKHSNHLMSSTGRWTVTAIPNEAWAKKVFPGCEGAEAVAKLWTAIGKAARIDGDDPIKAWQTHNETFAKRVDFLNNKQFKYLKIKSGIGTDMTMKLPDGHLWSGGGELCRSGKLFFPNIPTEEIFSAPDRKGVNGRIVSSMPLIYQGNLIEDIDITFEDGKAVICKASKNEALLKSITETDEGAAYLGEIALVPYSSPISEMNLLFYNTLFDENASCHVALGKGYANCIKGSEDMTEEQLLQRGLNDSLTHVDFMFGTADLSINGVDSAGNEAEIFKNGNFVI